MYTGVDTDVELTRAARYGLRRGQTVRAQAHVWATYWPERDCARTGAQIRYAPTRTTPNARVLLRRSAPLPGVILGWTQRQIGYREPGRGYGEWAEPPYFEATQHISVLVISSSVGAAHYRQPFLALPEDVTPLDSAAPQVYVGQTAFFGYEGWADDSSICPGWHAAGSGRWWSEEEQTLRRLHAPATTQPGAIRRALYVAEATQGLLCGLTYRATGILAATERTERWARQRLVADYWHPLWVMSPGTVTDERYVEPVLVLPTTVRQAAET